MSRFLRFFRIIAIAFLCVVCVHTVASASRCGTSPSNQGSFEVQTTNLSAGDTFTFYVGAEGTFTVNWGDGTSETYNNTIVQTGTGSGTITRNQYGNEPYFSHTYSSGGVKNITITGCATKYRDWQIVRWTTGCCDESCSDSAPECEHHWDYTTNTHQAISFKGNTKIRHITGSLGDVFPTRGGGDTNDSTFAESFMGCTNFNLYDKNGNLNNNLFGPEITHTKRAMFARTFKSTDVGEIPPDLFKYIYGPACYNIFGNTGDGILEAESLFAGTFQDTPIASIPQNLFKYRESGRGIRCSGAYMFDSTFADCRSLTTIPKKLFSQIGKNADNGKPRSHMFVRTFANTAFGDSTLRFAAGEGSINDNLFPKGQATALYQSTFSGNTGLSNINYRVFPDASPAKQMFESTFANTHISRAGGCNSGYTDNVFGPLAAGNGYDSDAIFRSTFKGSTIKSVTNNLFGLYKGGGTQAFAMTFENCANLKNDNPPSSCSSLTTSHSWLPHNVFGQVTDSGDGLFYSTFKNSGLRTIPSYNGSSLFATLTGTGANNMFFETFEFCHDLRAVPANLFKISSVGNSTFYGTFAFCDRLGQDTNGKINSNNSPIMSHYNNMGVNNTGGNYPSWGTYAFRSMFEGCTSLTDIVSNLVPALTAFQVGMFYRTFARSGLTQVPSSLFHSYHKAPKKDLFKETFAGCSNLQTVDNDIFANMVGAPAESMFEGTFREEGCDENGENCQYACGLNTTMEYLGSLFFGAGGSTNPNGPQGHVTGSPAKAMFKNTFKGCHGLTGEIPNYFFFLATNGPAAESMFEGTFQDTGISGNVISTIFDAGGNPGSQCFHSNLAPYMFKNTFKGCTNLTSISPYLFYNYAGNPTGSVVCQHSYPDAYGMYEGTFDGCSGLSNDISTLHMFENIRGGAKADIFKNTFRGCSGLTGSLPGNFFGTLGGSATGAFAGTFKGCTGLTGFVPKSVFQDINASAGSNSNVFGEIFDGATNMVTNCLDVGHAASTSADRCHSFETLAAWGNGNGDKIVRCCGDELRSVTYNPGADTAIDPNVGTSTPVIQYTVENENFTTLPIGTFKNDGYLMSKWKWLEGLGFDEPGQALLPHTQYNYGIPVDTVVEPDWNACDCPEGEGVAECVPHSKNMADPNNQGETINVCDLEVKCLPGWVNPTWSCDGTKCITSCERGIYNITLDYNGGTPLGGTSYVVGHVNGENALIGHVYLKYGDGFYPTSADASAGTNKLTNLGGTVSAFTTNYVPRKNNEPYQGFYTPLTAQAGGGTNDRGGVGISESEIQVINRHGEFNSTTFTTSNTTITARYGAPIYTITLNHTGGSGSGLYNQLFLRYINHTPYFWDNYELADTDTNAERALNDIRGHLPTWDGYSFMGYNLPAEYNNDMAIDPIGFFVTQSFINANVSSAAESNRITDDVTITAQWSPIRIPVCLYHNGATNASAFHDKVWLEYNTKYYMDNNGVVGSEIHYVDKRTDNGSVIPQKAGYIFDGYFGPLIQDDRSGGDSNEIGNRVRVVNDAGRFVNYTFSTTDSTKDCSCAENATNPCAASITAGYSKEVYEITLDQNGGTGGSPSKIYLWYANDFYSNSGATNQLGEVTPPTRNGYTFNGYYYGTCDNVGGLGNCTLIIDQRGRIASGHTTFTRADATITARWTPNIYEITVNDNCGDTPCTTSGVPNKLYLRYGEAWLRGATHASEHDSEITSMDVNPVRTGYIFNGYSHTVISRDAGNAGAGNSSITTTKIVDNEGHILYTEPVLTFTTEDTTIDADWLGACNLITLNPNGGSVGEISALYKRTGSMTWYTDSNCTEVYATTDEVIPKKQNYRFRGFFAAPAIADVEADADTTGLTQYIMTNGALSYNGYTLTVSGPTTIYAAWARECNTIDPGTCALDVTLDGIVTYTLDCPTGWVEHGEGTYNPYCSAGCYPILLDNQTRGGSTPNSYLYKFGGGTNATKWYTDDTCTTEVTTTPAPSKLNATFNGYYHMSTGYEENDLDTRSGGLTQVGTADIPSQLSDTWTVSGPETIIAYYNCNQNYTQNGTNIAGACDNSIYEIDLDDNGGDNGNGVVYEKYAEGYALDSEATEWSLTQLTDIPDYTDYTFRGYYSTQVTPLQANGNTGTLVIKKDGTLPTSSTYFNDDTTLYAGWAHNCVSPVSNGSCSLEVDDGGAVTYTTSCNSGYVLRNGTGGTYNPICDPGVFTITLDSKYYADANASGVNAGTNAAPSPIYVRYADNWYKSATINTTNLISALTTNPLYSTYTFDGFWTGKTGTGTQIIDRTGAILSGHTTDFTNDGILYAKWIQTNCSVTNGTGTPLNPTNNVPACSITCTNGYSQNGYLDATTTFTVNGTAGSNTVTAACVARTYHVVLDAKRYADANAQTGANPTTTGTTEYWYRYKTSPSTTPSTACYYYTVALASSADEVAANCIGGNHGDTITKPTMSGYAFDGYYVNKPGSGTQYVLNTGVTTGQRWNNVASDGTLYAKWNPNTYNITYNLKGGESDFMPVEYIQGGGSAYINTGVTPSSDYIVNTKIQTTSSLGSGVKMVYGARDAYKNKGFALQYLSKFYLQYNNVDVGGTITPAASTTYEITQNANEVWVNGTKLGNTPAFATFTPSATMSIFGVNTAGTTSASGVFKLYNFKMETAGHDVVFNGIPVRQISTNKCGLYDTISGNFFPSNNSSAQFTCPNTSAYPTPVTYDTVFGPVGHPVRAHSTFAGWNISGMDSTTHYAGATSTVSTINNVTTYGPTLDKVYFKNLTAVNNGTVTFTATWTCDPGYSSNAAGTSCDAVNYTMQYTCSDGAPGYGFSSQAPSAQTAHYLQSAPVGTGVSLPSGNSCQKIYGELGDPDYCADCFDFMGWMVKAEEMALLPQVPEPHAAGSTIPTWGKTGNTTWCKVSGVNDDWGSTAGSCATFTDSTPFTVYPVYEPKTYTISYMYATSTGPDTGNRPGTYMYTVGNTISAADLSLAHGSFVGWCKDDPTMQNNCTESVSTSVGQRDYGPHTYYAKWACDTGYTLGYDANNNPVCNANTITCEAGYYLSGDSATCEPCLVDNYCEGGTFTYNGSDQGLKECATEIATGWHSLGGVTATSKKSCYYNITLHKNGYSGTITANTGTGCKVASTATGTTNATLRLFYNTACTLPTFTGFTQTGYTNSAKWAASNTIDATTLTSISAVTATPTTTTYYVTKPSCAANYYKNNATTCALCSTLGGGLYTKSAAGNKTDNTVCYVQISVTAGKYIVDNTNASLTTCPAGSYCGGGNIYWPNTGNITTCPTGYTDGGTGLYAQNQCKTTCSAGQCLPTANGQCTNAGVGNWSAGGVVAYGSTLTCNACASGLTTIGYGHGADEVADCGRILHIGNNHVYLRSNKKTTPSLNVKIGDTVFYGNMSTTMTNMSDGISQKLKMKYGNNTYSVYDDSARN